MKQLRKYSHYPQGVASHKDLLDYILNKAKGLKIVLYNTVDNCVGCVDTNVDTAPDTTIPDTTIPFYFENVGTGDAVISIQKNNINANTASLEISIDNTNWETWGETSTTALSKTIGAGERLYIRNAEDVGYINSFSVYNYFRSTDYNQFSSTGANIIIGGNIMSLGYKNFENEYTIEQTSAYSYLFYNMSKLVDASRLVLPATTLAEGCYNGMFKGCTSLTTAPELPATTLANQCYGGMFYNCVSLTTAPELPATTLEICCYADMFLGCTSLTTAPELPATILQCADSCYSGMFYDCTSLTTAPELPATTLALCCYSYMFYGCTSLTTAPSILPATTLADECYQYMFSGCTSLTTAPSILPATILKEGCYQYMFEGCTSLTTATSILPATTLANSCYYGMFSGCTSLTTAPELPANILADSCYYGMFSGCSNLNYIKAMFTFYPSGSSYTQNWVDGVASTGTFVKNAQATWYNSGIVPTGWTVKTAIV